MARATFDFDGFNVHLLDENLRPVRNRRRAALRLLVGLVFSAGLGAGIYWASDSGWPRRAWDAGLSLTASIPRLWHEAPREDEPTPPVRPAETVESLIAERRALLARAEQMEAEARGLASDAIADLARLRAAIEVPQARAVPAPTADDLPKASKVPAEAPGAQSGFVSKPRARQKDEPTSSKSEEQAEILLFRKRQTERAVAQPIVGRPEPSRAVPVGAPAAINESRPVPQAPEQPIQAPVLLVEEGGVRVVGAEGERFVPIGGKLNGKRILATSPKIGLIVTEDSAIRVKNQER